MRFLCGGRAIVACLVAWALTAGIASAAVQQVQLLSPVSGNLTSSPLESPPHHIHFGDWAVDIAAGATTPVYARFGTANGPVSLSVIESVGESCSGGRQGGARVTVRVHVSGVHIADIRYLHLANPRGVGPINNGDQIGTLAGGLPINSLCWTGPHVHVEPRNVASYACFRSTPLGSGLGPGSVIGVVGGEWAGGVHGVCPAAALNVGGSPPPPAGTGAPRGHVDLVSAGVPGYVQVRGWTYDPDRPTESTSVHVYLGGPAGQGRNIGILPADVLRPDVGRAFPGVGDHHGFSEAIGGIPPGRHSVYVYAINVGGTPGDNPLLGSATIDVRNAAPGTVFGHFDDAEGLVGGRARVRGWTVDPDARTLPTNVHIYVDGPAGSGARGINIGAANLARPDVNRVHPGVGDNHGFTTVIDGLAPGVHTLYAYGINRAGGGDNPLLGIHRVRIPGPAPMGNLEELSGAAGGFVQLRGWTLDPDAPTRSLRLHVYIGGPAGSGRLLAAVPADILRPDVARVHDGAGQSHGFSTAIPGVAPGRHAIYVYALNAPDTPGGNPLLGSSTITIPATPAGSPVGSFDAAFGALGGRAFVSGWAIDPDVLTEPASVHVYIGGPAGTGARGENLGPASLRRDDVAAIAPAAGAFHGFAAAIERLAPGRHTLWAYAINKAGAGSNPLLRTITVTVPEGDAPPIAPPVPVVPATPVAPAPSPGGSASPPPRSGGTAGRVRPIAVKIAPRIPPRVRVRTLVRLSARASARSGRPVGACRVQRRLGRSWATIASVPVNRNGICSPRVRLGRVGTEVLRITFRGRSGFGSVTGRPVAVRVTLR